MPCNVNYRYKYLNNVCIIDQLLHYVVLTFIVYSHNCSDPRLQLKDRYLQKRPVFWTFGVNKIIRGWDSFQIWISLLLKENKRI